MSSSVFIYAPAPESRSIVDIAPSYGLFIDGEFVDGTGEAFKSVNPATEEVLTEVFAGSEADVERAVTAARRAFTRVWGPMRPADRGKYLFRIARLLQERAREFAVLESLDNGKPIRESRDVDVPLAAAHFFYHAGWADKLEYAGHGPDPRPHGVAGQVIPWNFPLLMLAWKVAPALATGNTVVLKPAETTPLSALLFAEICQQADLPPGVVNIVTGAGDTGRAVVEHGDVDKVAFTGSTEVGKSIARAVAGTRKSLTLELGGKAANIVFDDAPIDQAVEGIVQGIFFNQGHVCCAGSRLLVQENVHDEVITSLRRRIGTLPVRGFWFPPTVFTEVSPAHRIARDEVFGPVLSVLTFRTPDEAVAKANNTTYGLSAGIWTEKGSRILKIADQLRAGVVWANTFNKFDPTSPFGGYKQSGYGREGVVAARGAFPKWAAMTAYNRGQVLYRVAEVMEGRHVQFCEEVAAGEGLSQSKARAAVDAAIDRWVWYAGWTDKLAAVLGGANPVAGPYFDFSTPEPTGVVAVLAPQQSSLLGLVSVLAPVLAAGNTAVVVTSKDRPLPAVTLGEVLATSDVPGGVVNLLTGDAAEIGPWLAEHADVDGIDLAGTPAPLAMELERLAAGSIKRVVRPPAPEPDWTADPGLTRMTPFLETKTVWHPMGV